MVKMMIDAINNYASVQITLTKTVKRGGIDVPTFLWHFTRPFKMANVTMVLSEYWMKRNKKLMCQIKDNGQVQNGKVIIARC